MAKLKSPSKRVYLHRSYIAVKIVYGKHISAEMPVKKRLPSAYCLR